jgi:MFS family permease
LIAAVGEGWLFVINAGSYAAVMVSLWLLRVRELHTEARPASTRGSMLAGFRYVWQRPDLVAVLVMLLLLGTFGFNFAIFISTMSVTVFHGGADQYGLLSSVMAVGTLAGALLAAGWERPRFRSLLFSAAVLGVGFAFAAVAPDVWLFGVALAVIGVSTLTFTNATNSLMQLTTEPVMRGRVMALRLAVAVGTTPIGAPVIGWIADAFSPRWALGVGAVSGLAATAVALAYLAGQRRGPASR